MRKRLSNVSHGCHIMYSFKIVLVFKFMVYTYFPKLSYSALCFIELCEILCNQHRVIV